MTTFKTFKDSKGNSQIAVLLHDKVLGYYWKSLELINKEIKEAVNLIHKGLWGL